VPEAVDSPGHADALPAEVTLNGVAASNGRDPVWDRSATSCASSWCHGPSPASASSSSPSWIGPGKLDCTSCHGAPPAAPHPQIADCSRCHGEIVAEDDVTMIAKSRHVDGIVDVAVDKSCTACHGGANPAPPKDLSGSSSTTSPGVGAHQTHILGTARSRPVACGECHVVPENVLDAGHMDSPPPAELTFSGVALAYGAAPVYASGSCQSSACHGAVFPDGHASGGSNTTPLWTTVDGTQAACGTCHGLPPPAPHPKVEFNPICSACHEDIAPDNATFVHPELHVDGVVTFTVP
jgi:predicted CxxxxCH...CXXCH cytochrome family protein